MKYNYILLTFEEPKLLPVGTETAPQDWENENTSYFANEPDKIQGWT